MSSINATNINGDVSVGRNVAVGGNASVSGDLTVSHNLKVSGWLEAKNIRGVSKGIFPTVAKLRAAYPTPHDGWYAGVGTSSPFTLYVGDGGDWVTDTGWELDVTVDLTEYATSMALQAVLNTALGAGTETAWESPMKVVNFANAPVLTRLVNTQLTSGSESARGLTSYRYSVTGGHILVFTGGLNETRYPTAANRGCLQVAIGNFKPSTVAQALVDDESHDWRTDGFGNGIYVDYTAFNVCVRRLSYDSEGNPVIEDWDDLLKIDDALSRTSFNPVRNSVVYAALENALRTSDLTLGTGTNIADKTNIEDVLISNTGNRSASTTWKSIGIDVRGLAGQQITFGGFYLSGNGYWSFFNGTTKIDGGNGRFSNVEGGTAATVTVPQGATTLYFDIWHDGYSTAPTGWTTSYDELMANVGGTLAPFAPYIQFVTEIDGYPLLGGSQGGSSSSGDIIFDLPLSADGAGIEEGYAYIDSTTGAVKAKLAPQ